MKKIFPILVFFFLSGYCVFAQRSSPEVLREVNAPGFCKTKNHDLDTLLPGNWANSTGAAIYTWQDEMGYFFGTNAYGDLAYGQRFDVTDPYEIVKAVFWIGEKTGSTGNVVFTIWDFSGSKPGAVLASKTISLAEINASDEFDGAFVVEFDQPLLVTNNYLIGADISDLDEFEPDVYGLGNVSSMDGDGAGIGYAYILEGSVWIPVINYDLDTDIAIFPIVLHVELFSVTFNVNITGVDDFDPDEHKVFVTGSFNQWVEPGALGSVQMTLIPPAKEDDQLIYSATVPYLRGGDLFYKYFSDAFGHGWDGGEWEGEPNRYVFIQEDWVLNDTWGEPSVGIKDEKTHWNLLVFPNPAHSSLNVQSQAQIDRLIVLDLAGRKVIEKDVFDFETSVNINNLANGFYILKLISGRQIMSRKIQVVK